MKLTNAPLGYDSMPRGRQRWYYNPTYPLLPMFEYRKGDSHNANNFSFSWLMLRVWSMEHFSFQTAIEIESTGLNVTFTLGWLRIIIRLFPTQYPWLDYLRRKPAVKVHEVKW